MVLSVPNLVWSAARSVRFPIAMLVLVTGLAVMPAGISDAHAESQQTGWVGDLPIMDGMVIEPELGFAFDSPGVALCLSSRRLARLRAVFCPSTMVRWPALDGLAAMAAGSAARKA